MTTTSRTFTIPKIKTQPDFDNILTVLGRNKPQRPTLFEFFLNPPLHEKLVGAKQPEKPFTLDGLKFLTQAFKNAGYDYTTYRASSLMIYNEDDLGGFHASSKSLIEEREDFDNYDWPDPDDFNDYGILDDIKKHLPDGMKIIAFGPGGVLENAIQLVGYENICYMLADDEELAKDLFDKIGSILVRHYEIASQFDSVGACISNDDWGFKTGTMLSPEDMRKYVFPWHKKIVETIHNSGKPVILHSCGRLIEVMDDIIDDMNFDAKHSYEDAIMPVEEAYDIYHKRIAILGGMDLDYVCRESTENIYNRSKKMLKKTNGMGYALGTGNSVPDYCPDEKYFAMTAAVLDMR